MVVGEPARFAGAGAVVSGADMPAGKAVAVRLAQLGARLLVTGESADVLREVGEAIEARGGSAQQLLVDRHEDDAASRVVEFASSHLGGFSILVCHTDASPRANSIDIDTEQYCSILRKNLHFPFMLGSRAAAAWIDEGTAGRIVNVASIHQGYIVPGQSAHSPAMAGLRMLTASAAFELGPHGIRVNAVAPGYRTSDFDPGSAGEENGAEANAALTPLRRLCTPEDVALAVSFLASDDAAFITAQTLCVDGGRTCFIP